VLENSVKSKRAQNEITDIPHYFVSVYDINLFAASREALPLVIGGIFALPFGP
jgi:hypothetical protein